MKEILFLLEIGYTSDEISVITNMPKEEVKKKKSELLLANLIEEIQLKNARKLKEKIRKTRFKSSNRSRVLELALQNYNGSEISRVLNISRQTVYIHLKRLIRDGLIQEHQIKKN